MSYVSNRPRFQTVGFRPQSADPLNPYEGMTQYADGTVRPEGMYVYKNGSWQPIGSGASLNFDEFGDADAGSLTNFLTGNNAAFLGGGSLVGTFSLSTTAADLINGTRVFKYVQTGSSGNDYVARTPVSIPQGYRNRILSINLQYKFTGPSNSINFIVRDQTNNVILSTTPLASYSSTGNTATELNVTFLCPDNCASIAYGYQVVSATASAALIWDDCIVSPFDVSLTNIANTTAVQTYTTTFTGFTTTTATARYWFDGPWCRVRFAFSAVGLTGTNIQFSLPPSVSIDSTQMNGGQRDRLGVVKRITNSSTPVSSSGTYVAFYDGSNVTNVFCAENTNIQTYVKTTGSASFAAADFVEVDFQFPVLGRSASSNQIVLNADTFSTQSLPLIFKATAIVANDPIGTFNTYTYGSSTNTATIAGTAPTQTIADIQQNGFRLFGRAYNAASTAASPARVDIKVGQGFKAFALNGYSATGSVGPLTTDRTSLSSALTTLSGIDYSYDNNSGVLTLTAGIDLSTSSTTRHVGYRVDTAATAADGYFQISASRKPTLVGLPIDQTAYIKDLRAAGTNGGAYTSGTWNTRTLNTVEGNSSFLTLSSNQFTLPAGTYKITGSAPAYDVNNHHTRIRNVTDGTTAINGSSEYNSTGDATQTRSHVAGIITITATKTFSFQHFIVTNSGVEDSGFAYAPQGEQELYAILEIQKLA